jgi:hypothetical protein
MYRTNVAVAARQLFSPQLQEKKRVTGRYSIFESFFPTVLRMYDVI